MASQVSPSQKGYDEIVSSSSNALVSVFGHIFCTFLCFFFSPIFLGMLVYEERCSTEDGDGLFEWLSSV